MKGRLPIAVSLCALAVAAFAPAASASSNMQIGIADDALMQRSGALASQTAAAWKSNGVNQSRLMLTWSRIAPSPLGTKKPAGFDSRNESDPSYNWSGPDRAVDALSSNGIEITVVLTTPAPLWATAAPARREPTYKPDPVEFGNFVYAAATRYAGRVSNFILINEPNLWIWLTPQVTCKSSSVKSCTPASPSIYRRLYRAGYAEIKKVNATARVWSGAFAPGGRANVDVRRSSVSPIAFMKELACVTSRFKKDNRTRGCSDFSPLEMDGIAIHPHSAKSPPSKLPRYNDSVTISTIGRLTTTVDRIQKAGRIVNATQGGRLRRSKPLDVYIDEYGVQTNPPDKLLGVSTAKQNAYYQQATYMMWKNKRVRLLTFYLWRDEPVEAGFLGSGSWQSGFYFADGRPKESARYFRNPFWVSKAPKSNRATLWGQVRPGRRAAVTIERKRTRSAPYVKFAETSTNESGYFALRVDVREKSTFRFRDSESNLVSSARSVAP